MTAQPLLPLIAALDSLKTQQTVVEERYTKTPGEDISCVDRTRAHRQQCNTTTKHAASMAIVQATMFASYSRHSENMSSFLRDLQYSSSNFLVDTVVVL